MELERRRPAEWCGKIVDIGATNAPVAKKKTSRREQCNAIYNELLEELATSSRSLGWDVFVLAHVRFEINVLLLPVMAQRGNKIMEILPILLPGEFNPHWPFIVLYHRSHYAHDYEGETGGHYEVITWNSPHGDGGIVSLFPPDHIVYPHLALLASQSLSITAQSLAVAQMVAYDARTARARVWKRDEVVGVSTRALKRTAKRPTHNIIGVVAQVVERNLGHPSYRVLTIHGLVDRSAALFGPGADDGGESTGGTDGVHPA